MVITEALNNFRLEGKRMHSWAIWLVAILAFVGLYGYAKSFRFWTVVPTKQPAFLAIPPSITPAGLSSSTLTLATSSNSLENNSGVITDLAHIFSVKQTPTLVDRQVLLQAIPIQKVNSTTTVLIGDIAQNKYIVVYIPSQETASSLGLPVKIVAGEKVNISGFIRAMPGPEALKNSWGLSSTEIEAIKDQAIYIEAQSF